MDMGTVPIKGSIVSFNGRVALRALLVAGAYSCAAHISPSPNPLFWPPHAILLAGLLMSPLGSWWAILLAMLPAQFLSDPAMQIALVLERTISNCGGALLGAAFVGK